MMTSTGFTLIVVLAFLAPSLAYRQCGGPGSYYVFGNKDPQTCDGPLDPNGKPPPVQFCSFKPSTDLVGVWYQQYASTGTAAARAFQQDQSCIQTTYSMNNKTATSFSVTHKAQLPGGAIVEYSGEGDQWAVVNFPGKLTTFYPNSPYLFPQLNYTIASTKYSVRTQYVVRKVRNEYIIFTDFGCETLFIVTRAPIPTASTTSKIQNDLSVLYFGDNITAIPQTDCWYSKSSASATTTTSTGTTSTATTSTGTRSTGTTSTGTTSTATTSTGTTSTATTSTGTRSTGTTSTGTTSTGTTSTGTTSTGTTSTGFVAPTRNSVADFSGASGQLRNSFPATGRTTNVTLSAWIYLSAPRTSGNHIVMHNGVPGYTGFGLVIVANTNQLGIYSAAAGLTPSTVSYTVPLYTWLYVSITSPSLNNWDFYVNGVLVGSASTSTVSTGTARFSVAGNYYNTNNNYNGMIDSIAVWNGVRTPSQLSADSTTNFVGNEAGLALWAPFNEGAGSTSVTGGASASTFVVQSGTFAWSTRSN